MNDDDDDDDANCWRIGALPWNGPNLQSPLNCIHSTLDFTVHCNALMHCNCMQHSTLDFTALMHCITPI